MIAVIFEVDLAEGQTDQYLALAAALRGELDAIDGFLSVERFQSMSAPNRMVSLSFFRGRRDRRRRHPRRVGAGPMAVGRA